MEDFRQINIKRAQIQKEAFVDNLQKSLAGEFEITDNDVNLEKALDLTHGGKLVPKHIVDAKGHKRLVYVLPDQISNHHVPLAAGDKFKTKNGEEHELVRDKGHDGKGGHLVTLKNKEGKIHDKYIHNLEGVEDEKKVKESKGTEEIDSEGIISGDVTVPHSYLKPILEIANSKQDFRTKVLYGIDDEGDADLGPEINKKIDAYYDKYKATKNEKVENLGKTNGAKKAMKEVRKEKISKTASKDTTSTPHGLLDRYGIKDVSGFSKQGKRSSVFDSQYSQSLSKNGALIEALRKIPIAKSKGYEVEVKQEDYHSKPERHEISSEREWSESKGTNITISFKKDGKDIGSVYSSDHYEYSDDPKEDRGKGYLNTSGLIRADSDLKELFEKDKFPSKEDDIKKSIQDAFKSIGVK